ncbi:A-kinase anchor protein 13 isoform X4 [Apis florea]|uniref:A-kinase anchor protein 13 isoform X4 n=1 Tax=Apis florea TaxID=7463 RepID=UPI000629741C|nr:A-kinase anchor protein 13 isoform X4 [Apis florea]
MTINDLSSQRVDECPNSGEDSEEDVITDYLGSSHSDCDRIPIINGDLGSLNLHGNIITETGYTKDNTEKTAITMSEGTDEQQQQHSLLTLGTNNQIQTNPLVPIISVTPHSPGLAKNYPVLEDNLQHLHEIHDCIQRMRDLTLSNWGYNHRTSHNDVPQRLTSSCPSLCPLISSEIAPRSSNNDTGSDPDLLVNCSTNSSPTHFPSVGPRSQNAQGIDRRRSWTDLEDTRCGRRRYSGQNHLQAQNMRQRSISLSSLDSEMEIELHGKSCTRPVGVGNRTCRSQASTHSLNEADLVQSEYQKIVTKRFKGSQRLADSSGLMPGLTGSRLPLQKSISTPSIVTPQVNAHLAETVTRTTPSLKTRRERNEKGSGSETETEDLHTPNSHEFHEDREGTPNAQISLDELLTDAVVYDDHHSEKSRRKRGSIFFRKKKDKSGKKTSQQHLWTTIMAGPQGSLLCDVCMKHSTNKPILLHCDHCGVSVHQSQGCKDQLVLECIKSKNHSSKAAIKTTSSISTTSSSYNVKRGSTASLPLPLSSGSGREINSKKTVTSYSPWRRVATKLGVNQTINEEKDGDGQHRDISSGLEGFDLGDDAYQFTVGDLEGLDPELGLAKEEPDSWSTAIGHNIALRLVDNCERKVKRQEHIYEFVLTEKHHCLVLLAMERIFAEGLRRHFRLGQPDLERMFPRLRDLIDIHLRFLQKLRKRQNTNPVVPTIADILVDQFSGENAQRMKSAYGEFCSRHRDAVEAYKYYLRHDPRFARFVRQCQSHPLLKKKGIPECILFVTQRLTKYPLLVEPLIKTGIAQEEGEDLRKALSLVKEILADVDACVADKEREDRKLEIYNKIDAKSFATYRGTKFKKSDIMAFNRILKFEGTAYLMQGRGKMTAIVVVVLSDILFFLAERDQKYAFFVPDNKAGIVSLQKLLVREKAGQESRGIYLISSNPAEPEMFELKIQKPKDKQLWIQAIRSAVEACPQEFENEIDTLTENNNNNEIRDTRSSSISFLSVEERQRLIKIKESHVLKIIGELRKKDAEQALLLEEKINLQMQLLHAANIWSANENSDNERIEKVDKEILDYTRLVHNEGTDTTQLRQEVVAAIQEATKLASSLSFSAGGATLSRSLSSAGERHSEAYVPSALCVPRRAETFAGFDHNKEKYPLRESAIHSVISLPKVSEFMKENLDEKESQDPEVNKDQQWAAIRLSHHVYRLVCIISNQMTTVDSLQAQLAAYKEGSMGKSNNRPNPNRQLEELRNLQDQLSREKAAFRAASQQEQKQLEEERTELARQREQLAAEQRDVTQQRDQLYRRLEALERQGVTLVTGSAPTSTTIHLSHLTQGNDTVQTRKSQPDAKRIPLNLISATNQQKVQSNLPVKQQLPLKLASGSNNNRSGSTSNNSPDRHSRTGSSPAIVTGSTYSSPELGNNHAGTSHSSNRSLRITRSPPEYPHQQQHQRTEQQQPLEEEVIFF